MRDLRQQWTVAAARRGCGWSVSMPGLGPGVEVDHSPLCGMSRPSRFRYLGEDVQRADKTLPLVQTEIPKWDETICKT